MYVYHLVKHQHCMRNALHDPLYPLCAMNTLYPKIKFNY